MLRQAEPLTVAGPGSLLRRAPAREAVAVGIISFIVLLAMMLRDLNVFDEGIVLSGAMRVLAGEVIHRDFYSTYGPAQDYIVAGILRLTDHGFFYARVYDLIVRAGILAAMFYILRQQCTLAVALLFSGIAGIWMMTVENYLYPIFPCILLTLIASYLTLRVGTGKATFPRMMGVGALSGITALFRYDVGAFLLIANILAVVALAVLTEAPGARIRQCVLRTVAFGTGAVVAFAPAAIAFLLVAPINAFIADVVDYAVKYYAKTRSLPFPRLHHIGAKTAVYLPFLGIALAGVELARQLVRRPDSPSSQVIGPEARYLIVFGATALLMLFKGLVRVSPVHMMIAIIPTLIVLAVLLELWWRRGLGMARIAALVILVAAIVPALFAAGGFWKWKLDVQDRPVAGWLLETSGLVKISSAGTACDTAPASGFARLPSDDARVATYLAANTQPGERIFVGLHRTDKFVLNAMSIYYAAGRLPGTHWSEFDPGVQSRADIQTAIIDDLQRFGVRWVVRDKSFDGFNEPNESSHSSGVHLLDDYVDQHYRKVAVAGKIEIWLANGVTPPAPSTRACDATPVL